MSKVRIIGKAVAFLSAVEWGKSECFGIIKLFRSITRTFKFPLDIVHYLCYNKIILKKGGHSREYAGKLPAYLGATGQGLD